MTDITPDLKATSIANEVYPMLLEMCGNSGIAIADLIRELAAKQKLVDIRSGITALGQGGVSGVMSNDHSDNIAADTPSLHYMLRHRDAI